jgi:hypothetical protein
MDLIPIIPAVAMLSLAIVVAFVGKAILDNLDKIQWLLKGRADEELQYPPKKQTTSSLISNLKWGFILVGLGLALLLKEYIILDLSEAGTFGLMFLCAGFAFIIYYTIARQTKDKKENKKDTDE